MKGMKQTKQPSTKDKFKESETALQNMQVAIQMSQMMVKHLADQLSALQNDIGNNMGMLNDLQYRTLAMLKAGNFDKVVVEAYADEFKLSDFNTASDKEDIHKGYINDAAGLVTEDSIVIVTTTTPDLAADQGIFRSKFPMSECLTPDLRSKLLGAKVSDIIESTMYNVKHLITILEVKKVEHKQPIESKEAGE